MDLITLPTDDKARSLGCYYDPEAAQRAIRFIEKYIKLSTTNRLMSLYPFQRAIVGTIFGWKQADGRRRFTRVLLTSGKKSLGKSVLASAIATYLLIADNVNAPLVMMGAVTKEQAHELYKESLYAVQNSDFLSERIKVNASTHRLFYPKKSGEIRVSSSDVPSRGGLNCSAWVLDEVALMPNDGLYSMAKGSMKARREPLLIMCSNAGWNRDHFYHTDIYKPMKDVQEGKSDDIHMLPVIHELPETYDWKDSSLWHLANPGLQSGLLSLDAYADEFADALRTRAGEIWFRRFALNQWTATETVWIDLQQWDDLRGIYPDLTQADYYLGFDGSTSLDWTSLVAVYPVEGKYYVRSYNFVPEAAARGREKQNAQKYNEFSMRGELTIVPGVSIDFQQLYETIQNIPGYCRTIIYDPREAVAFAQQLERDGYEVKQLVQSHANYNEACKFLDKLIAAKTLVHSGSGAERWCISNTQLDTNGQSLVKPAKGSDANKIDFTCSLLMALSEAMIHDESGSNATVTFITMKR